jgi:hypothetical protein
MEGVLPLTVLGGLIGGFLYSAASKKTKERFEDLVNQSVASALGPKQAQYIRDAASRYNPLMNMVNPYDNPLIAKATVAEADEESRFIQEAVQVPSSTPNDPSFQTKVKSVIDTKINTGSGGIGIETVKKCEEIKTADSCDAFDDPDFKKNCGLCFDEGRDSLGNPAIGGLFVLQDDNLSAQEAARRMGTRKVNYKPTIGKCKPQHFAVTKEQCIKLKNQIDCRRMQDFYTPGCSQCFEDSKFNYVDDEIVRIYPTLYLVGEGNFAISLSGTSEKQSGALSETPTKLVLGDMNEGDILLLQVSTEKEGVTPRVAGFLEGTTLSGNVRIDIFRMIQIDLETNSAPSMNGMVDIEDTTYTYISPKKVKLPKTYANQPTRFSFGKKMNLKILNTYTFLDPTDGDEAIEKCPNAPYITDAKSAEVLESGPCFKKGSGPGKFSQECLQAQWENVGCETTGEGYPNTDAKAAALMTGPDGKPLSLAKLTRRIINAYEISSTGREKGVRVTIPKWDEESRFCTGRSIKSPCDIDDKENGPLSTDCLEYIYQNKGAVDGIPGGIGPTYQNSLGTTSLDPKNPQYCTPNGTAAPTNQNGDANYQVIDTINNNHKGVRNVRNFYNNIHMRANDNSLKDSERQEAVQQCYGLNFNPLPTMEDKTNTLVAPMCVPETIVAVMQNPSRGVNRKQVMINDEWSITFGLKLNAVMSTWTNILQISSNGEDHQGFGARVPGIYVIPNSTGLLVSVMQTESNWEQWIRTSDIPLLQEVQVNLSYKNNLLTLNITGATNIHVIHRIPEKLYKGMAQFMAPSIYHVPFRGTVTNLSFCSNNVATSSVLDVPSGRKKTPFNPVGTNQPFDLPMYGGGGGFHTRRTCPGNSYITEFYGGVGDVIDRIGARCSDGTNLGAAGGGGGGPFSVRSDQGFNQAFITNRPYWRLPGGVVAGVEFQREYQRVAGPGHAGTNRSPVYDCGEAKMIGFRANTGGLVDKLGFTCKKV